MEKNTATSYSPSGSKVPVIRARVDKSNDTIIFSFERFDSLSRWSESKREIKTSFWDIADKLKSFEEKTWAALAANEKEHHSVDFYKLEKPAKEAATAIGIDEYDKIWSLRLNGKQRIWGIRYQETRYFMVIWWDPEHQVCKSKK